MKKMFSGAIAGLVAVASVLSAVPASAQWRDGDRDRREASRGNDRNGRQWDRREVNRGRDNRQEARRDVRREQYRWNRYGRQQGYNGYRGRWREGQRYGNWRNSRYYVNDWRAYNLPAPRQGYRYYREDNGDIIMAAIATGAIGLILGSALGR